MKNLNKKAMPIRSWGFTLIELLVVITIIGVLSTMAVIALAKIRSEARDDKRQSDMKILQTAIELYISTNETPPILTDLDVDTWAEFENELIKFLPGGLPEDPKDRIWGYCERNGKYLIAVTLEDNSKIIPGDLDNTNAEIINTYDDLNSINNCIFSDDQSPSMTLDCRDEGAGGVSMNTSKTTFCLGSV